MVSIEEHVSFGIHSYEKLGGLSKCFDIKGDDINWGYKLSVPFN